MRRLDLCLNFQTGWGDYLKAQTLSVLVQELHLIVALQ